VQEVGDAKAGAQGAAFAAAWNSALEEALRDAELLQALRRLLDKGDRSCNTPSAMLRAVTPFGRSLQRQAFPLPMQLCLCCNPCWHVAHITHVTWTPTIERWG
jgi:hypothetical protein